MKKTAYILLAIALISIIYGYWGAFTQAGNKVYDEMDGMLPFFIFLFGLFLFAVFLVLVFIMIRKSKGKKVKTEIMNRE